MSLSESASCARVTSCLLASFTLSILSQTHLPSHLTPLLEPKAPTHTTSVGGAGPQVISSVCKQFPQVTSH